MNKDQKRSYKYVLTPNLTQYIEVFSVRISTEQMDIFFSDLPQSLLAHAGKVVP
jgi:hypothetical protein